MYKKKLPKCCCSTTFAGDRGVFLSFTGAHDAIVIKPEFIPFIERNGIRNRVVSCITPNAISADPNGTAVCETFSLTSNTVNRINDSACKLSHCQNVTVQ